MGVSNHVEINPRSAGDKPPPDLGVRVMVDHEPLRVKVPLERGEPLTIGGANLKAAATAGLDPQHGERVGPAMLRERSPHPTFAQRTQRPFCGSRRPHLSQR